MQTITVTDLQNNLGAYLKQVLLGEELLVRDNSRTIARVLPPTIDSADLDAEESALVAAGVMRLPTQAKSDDWFSLPAPEVPLDDVLAALKAVRDED